ncbi:MAG: sigma-70 family RNA polymerase sigma factor [Verrucomicrobiota bacterium]
MPLETPRDEQFFQTFLKHEEDLKVYARSLLPTWEAVDEAMQEASLVIWRKYDQLRRSEEFLHWAKVIVRFECLKARRTHARDRHTFSDDVFDLIAEEEPATDEVSLVREREALETCLGNLEPNQRELVLLPYRGHGSVAQLATQSGRTTNSLYKKIRRIREILTKCVSRRLSESKI